MKTNARDEKWSDWIEWSGGECPVPSDTFVQWKGREANQNGSAPIQAGNLYWEHKDDAMDIIAYRYKIKEPESDMHPDLEYIAKHMAEWSPDEIYRKEFTVVYLRERGCRKEICFCERESVSGKVNDTFEYHQWQAARQQLGLDQPEVTPEEEETWQAKERELIGGPRKAESFLRQAADLMAERGKQYDQSGGERSMGRAVTALNAITGRGLTEAEGWLLMSLVKRVRQHSGAGYHKDSAEDAVAYAALEAEALESGHDS